MTKEGKHYRFEDVEFWAEDGLIFIEDHKDGEFKIDTCRDFAMRAHAINEAARREYQRGKYPSEHKRLVDCVCNMRDCFKEAREQGDPMDPRVVAQQYRERRKATLIKDGNGSVSINGNGTSARRLITGIF